MTGPSFPAPDQGVIPGLPAVSRTARDLAAFTHAREARRGCEALPAGGLFDECAQRQTDLFDKPGSAGRAGQRPATPDPDGKADAGHMTRQTGREG